MIAIDYRDGELIFLANKNGYLTERVVLKDYDKRDHYFLFEFKSSAFVVKSCSDYIGGKMYLVYSDSALRPMDLGDGKGKDESSNFRIVGKIIKNIADVE